MTATTQPALRTPLYPNHVAAGARLVDFAGWESISPAGKCRSTTARR